MNRLYAVLASVSVAALLGGVWVMTQQSQNADQFAQCRSSQIAGGSAQIGGPFELLNGKGETVTDKDVITEPSLIYFGYTFCPDVCPMDTARKCRGG